MSMSAIESYFKSNIYKPFFMAVGDIDYKVIKNKLAELGEVEFFYMSKFCRSEDKKPDLDKLKETLRMADVDCQSNKIVLLGLGEYLALEGANKAIEVIDELLSFNLGSAHALFLLRGITPQLQVISKGDPRLKDRQIAFSDDTSSTLSFMFSSVELKMYPQTGIEKALMLAEEGIEEQICVNTSLEFSNSLYYVQKVQNPYEAIRKVDKSFDIPKSYGSHENWTQLLIEVNQNKRISEVFRQHKFDDSLSNFYQMISGSGYVNWLYYVFLYANRNSEKNPYLKYVIGKSKDFEEFKTDILNAISEISHSDKMFEDYYWARKKLVSQYPDADIAVFVSNNRFNASESIYKLTDNTRVEREEIIADIAQHGLPKELDKIYPDLALYLNQYHFNGDALNELLTKYFQKYKMQKVLNKIEPEFLEEVDKLAVSREYNRLRTRDELVASIDTSGSFLCWIDALGVEYLSFIVGLAQRRGLAVSVNVGRAELPTLTFINKHFYDAWPEESKRKIEALDDTKHSESGGYKYGPSNQYAIHLAKELQIISDAIDEAATDLGLRKYDRYVIASDHGASRLAVLRKKEEKYETDTKGEHSGRCCKTFPDYDLPFATEENGYIVLADYGRFKGSRAANVEVHGGASLEEVVVPVITLSLKDSSIEIKVVDTVIKADYKTGAAINLFVNKAISQQLLVEYKGKKYAGESIDENHYKVSVPEIKRAGTVEAEIYIGEDLVSHITVKAVGKSASMNSDFDDLV